VAVAVVAVAVEVAEDLRAAETAAVDMAAAASVTELLTALDWALD
jgi:hypothetical protein